MTRTQQWGQEASFDPILLLSQMTFDFWKEVLGSLPHHWWASKVGFPTGSHVCAQKGLSLVHGLLSASGSSSLFLKTGLHFHSALGPTNSAARPMPLCRGHAKAGSHPRWNIPGAGWPDHLHCLDVLSTGARTAPYRGRSAAFGWARAGELGWS